MDSVKPTQDKMIEAVEALRQGHLVGMPTETVYGLAADALNDLAVAKIYEVKARPQFNPLILHVDSPEQAKQFAIFNDLAEKLTKAFWPGPLTLVLPLKEDTRVSRLLTAGLSTIAVRCPAHPVARELITNLGRPVAAPSANPSTKISPTCAEHVRAGFEGKAEPKIILDGGLCKVGLESTVIDLTTELPVILRPGQITAENLAPYCQINTSASAEHIKAPGMMLKHYAPRQPVRLNATEVREGEILLAYGDTPLKGAKAIYNLSFDRDLTEAAANLFAMLHQIDQEECQGIAVMPISDEGLGIAINDRLIRAAAK